MGKFDNVPRPREAQDLECSSFQLELAAVAEVGRRRATARGVEVVTLLVLQFTLTLGLGLSLLPAVGLFIVMYGVAELFIRWLTNHYFIDRAASRYGVPRENVAASMTDMSPL